MKLIQQIPRWAALAAVSFSLVACGGDDNDSSSSSSISSTSSSSSVSSSSDASSVDTISSSSTSVATTSSATTSSATISSVESSSSLSESSSSSSVSSAALPTLVLNEMRSDGGGYDYIEIYNPGNSDYTFVEGEWAVNDLKGFSEDKVPGVLIPAGSVIPAKGFLLVAVDQTAVPFGAPEGTIIGGAAEFGLGKGDTALLTHKGEIIDEKGWAAGSHVNTIGRLPDGGEWHDEAEALTATPGVINALPVVNPPASQSDIVINEVVSKGRADLDFDYVELYNKSSQPYVFAEGEWSLSDSENTLMPIPGGTTIPGHGFLVLLTDVATGTNLPTNAPAGAITNSTGGFGIGKNENIILARFEAIIDNVSHGDFHVNAYGRLPDGGEFIDLGDGSAPQLYASPGLKNFMTPALNLTVTTLNFSSFNDDETTLENSGFRVFGLNADLAKDVEPEYIAVAADSKTAWVTLQENNGVARINLDGTPAITNIFPLGFKDYGAVGNEIDPSDRDDKVEFAAYPKVFGIYQPDGIAAFNDGGMDYVITANEGDVRDYYTNFEEGVKVADITLDESDFPNATELKQNAQLGRLLVTQFAKTSSAETVFSELLSFGARSFSIWNGTTGEQVYDSGNDLEVQANNAGVYPDDRSDAKGVEPENLAIGMVGSKRFVFVGLERADAVAVYDITDLGNIQFSQMLITEGDDAPEGILFISAANSPNGNPLLVVSNEESGNVTVYQGNVNGEFSFASRLILEGGVAAAEISAYDPITKRLFVLNNGELLANSRIEVLNLADPAALSLLTTIDLSPYGGGINSVAVSNGKIAGALQAVDKTQTGTVVVFDTSSYALLGIAKVGALPDMLTFSPDGKFILTADEGEAKDDYSYDPIGSVSIITLP
ncbi:hypothetical protein O59_001278 [Cellvibrio sp. BR]|nr:hypothetical protein O59_001278 [Cellvibrio sp. BR]